MNECIEKTSDPIRVLRDKGRPVSLIVRNLERKEYCIVRVDGCYISDCVIERCDYLVVGPNFNAYIELKGSDIEKALRQVLSSIEKINGDFGGNPCKIVIVSTKAPAFTGFQKAVAKINKSKISIHGVPQVKTMKHSLAIDDL
jgi:hypothetical protein